MKSTLVVLALGAIALGCGGGKPTGFGVNLTVETDQVPAPDRAKIITATLIVTGAESYMTSIDVSKATGKEIHIHYVPGVHSGSLTFEVDGLAAGGTVIASGISSPVEILDGKAVDATVSLSPGQHAKNGASCQMSSECMSGNCVDGVCCDTPCAGTCESCNVTGMAGTCSPIPANTDPDQECGAKIPPPPPDGGIDEDGGSDDGGVGDVDGGMALKQPDGGLQIDFQKCAGTCNGNRACTYPTTTTTCGTVFCSASAEIASMTCDGAGGCNQTLSECTDYTCDPANAMCRSMCSTDSDCQSQDYCNLNINKCVGKKMNGATCNQASECQSNVCAAGNVCCNTQCDAPNSCNNPGTAGQCQCPGVTCAAGVACQLYYRDADGDGYGDLNGTVGAGTAKAGCTGQPPAGFVADHTDCDDGDGNAHPGQTAFFYAVSAGTHTWDYNCDGNPNEKETIDAAYCGFCSTASGSCAKSYTCGAANNQGTIGNCVNFHICNLPPGGCFNACVALGGASGFTTTVACGAFGTITNCGTCTVAGGSCGTSSGGSKQQGCH